MSADELAFATTQQLIDELMKRHTFLGVLVHSDGELKESSDWGEERVFKVRHSRNLDTPQATRLLDRVAEYMELHY